MKLDKAASGDRPWRLCCSSRRSPSAPPQTGKAFNGALEKKERHGRPAIGRSPYLQSIHVEDGDHLVGQIVPVEILDGQQNSLKGRRLGA